VKCIVWDTALRFSKRCARVRWRRNIGPAQGRSGSVETDSLRLFVHLSRTLHFGRTSRECHVSASALSRSIQRLEQETGAALFTRDSRRVALTVAGRQLQGLATELLGRWDQALSGLRPSQQTLRGTLSLFCTVTAAHSLLPALLVEFRAAHPEVAIRLETGYAADALQPLLRGEVDVTVAALPDRLPARLLTRVIAHTPLLFVAPPSSLPGLSDARPPEWASVPMILPEHGIARTRIDQWFRHKHITPKVYSEVSGHEAILALIKLGCGVGIVPELVLEKSPLRDDLRVLDVRPRLPAFRVAACIKRASLKSPLVEAFWASIAEL
jgi:LysR family positive regulator for ilvC